MNEPRKELNYGRLLLEYFYKLLSNGITSGITEKEYYQYINEIIDVVNLISGSDKKIQIDEKYKDFENVIKQANKITPYGINFNRIRNGQLVAFPNYKLIRSNVSSEIIGYNGEEFILRTILLSKIPAMRRSNYDIKNTTEKNVALAKIVSSFCINDLINKYVKNRVILNEWPSFWADIDEYIFKKDVALLIGELGTKQTFKKAYLHAFKIVCEMLDKCGKEEQIRFSNCPDYPLAHANYLKFVQPKEFGFLKKYSSVEYGGAYPIVNLDIVGDDVLYTKFNGVKYDPYGLLNKGESIQKGIVRNDEVRIMEKRIGVIKK